MGNHFRDMLLMTFLLAITFAIAYGIFYFIENYNLFNLIHIYLD